MADPKGQLYKAKGRAMKILKSSGYRAVLLSDPIFDIEASRELEMRKIKICSEIITADDINRIKDATFPIFCKKEIWCKKTTSPDFVILEIK